MLLIQVKPTLERKKMEITLSDVAGVVFLVGYIPYFWSMFKGDTEPIKVSWFIWAAVDWVSLVGMNNKGSITGLSIAAPIGATITAFLSLKYGVPGWSKWDIGALCFAALGIPLALIMQDANVSILINAVVVFVGSYPTFDSVWHEPQRENKWTWMLYFTACVIALCAIPEWTIEHAAQTVSFSMTETIMVYLVLLRPRPK